MAPQQPTTLAMDGLVHDLNNALQTILQAAELISCEDTDVQLVDIIRRSVQQAQLILGAAAVKPAPLLDVIHSAAQFVADYVVIHGGLLPVVVSIVDPPIWIARPEGIQRALVNLFLNSAQAAARERRPQVTLQASARLESGDVVLTIADDGPGIPQSLLGRIFTQRAVESTDHPGLGLRIVQAAVQDSGGTITGSNSESGGAVFTIRIPNSPAGKCPVANTHISDA
jgi:signal transduction histidine kinase